MFLSPLSPRGHAFPDAGAILFEETLYQSSKDGKPFVDILSEQGIKPGIKVDTGLQQLPGRNGETATQGLDGLGDRMKAYREQVCTTLPCWYPR